MWWQDLLWVLLGVVIGGVAGFFLARKYLMNQIKKNPPINEKMIRAMFREMGRKPSEAQIKSVMNAMRNTK